jgi:hypothetical protein
MPEDLPTQSGNLQYDQLDVQPTRRYCFGRFTRKQLVAVVAAVTVAVGAVLCLIVVYVAGPMLGQQELNSLVIRMDQFEILNAKASSFVGRVHLILDGTDCGPFSGTTAPATVTMRYGGQDFARLSMPAASMSAHGISTLWLETEVDIDNMVVWNAFSRDVVRNGSLSFELHGNIDVTAFFFTFHGLPLNKVRSAVAGSACSLRGFRIQRVLQTVEFQGCAGLRQVEMEVFDLTQSMTGTDHPFPRARLGSQKPVVGSSVGRLRCVQARRSTSSSISLSM